MNPSSKFWYGKRVFISGHTGFKGSWLSTWLSILGAEVHGYALQPESHPNLFTESKLFQRIDSTIADIRDIETLSASMKKFRPDIVFHLAAQALVRPSYTDPTTTYSTNVMGTVNMLEAARHIESIRAFVNITSDKCYENKEWVWGYKETDPLGGRDPYSNSKSCAELVTDAFRQSYYEKQCIGLATARAGNVIGGGDWSTDRLIPDIFRALEKNTPPIIRSPQSIRPWQHVLDPISGYLCLAQNLYQDYASFSQAWNFGPREEGAKTVQYIVENIQNLWGNHTQWITDTTISPHESLMLKLDISKTVSYLKWQPHWPLDISLSKTVEWHQKWYSGSNAIEITEKQIKDYIS